MQRLIAPTRKEIDTAHARRIWLDIGVPGVRNLFFIAPTRALLWFILGLSSVPLHFMYNSVIFSTISANLVTFQQTDSAQALEELVANNRESMRFANLTSIKCQEQYNAQFISNHGSGWGLLAIPSLASRYDWTGNVTGVGKFGLANEYAYCMSEITQPQCQVQLSLIIMGIVILANFVKTLAVAFILWRLDHETIVTIGDAIESFLQNPDSSTKNCCLLSRSYLEKQWVDPTSRAVLHWRQQYRPYWYMACSPRRWVVSILCALATIVPGAVLVTMAQLERRSSTNIGWNGFGRVSGDHFLSLELPSGGDSILTSVLIVNSPQVVISLLYVLYNGAFTLTSPSRGQRSTYFLQLPYIWSVPLLTVSILLHWFISQSIFLARVGFYMNGKPYTNDFYKNDDHWIPIMPLSGNVFTGIGYSDMALVASISTVVALVVACRLVAGFRTFAKGLPVGGTSSAVISAACHVRYMNEGDRCNEDITEQPLQWGVTIRGGPDIVGHMCFSDGEVERPEYGSLYAGASPADN
ncbi:hypothetical protein EK21DRAFT_118567 [Setomelanomma holmii]|uniref:DUF6536 domain-containing protein n=1 Tax=Setomelanomma holmii TaxID=210430 RepID=A0A9P4LET5_9PLEO|nr:hypothetical protein EK21DRAFT_118567 [Setomelanomma holmii]